MKTVKLLLTAVLIGLTTVAVASSKEKGYATLEKDLDLTSRYRYAQPILFVERGVEFLIFADGSFDFNTDFLGNSALGNNFYRNRRGRINRASGAPGTQSRHFGARGVRVTHDYLGRVRRIGNVFINYDRQGRIKRAGTVYMRYKFGQLSQVGNLKLHYNRRGRLIRTTGFVNFSNQGCGFCGISGCQANHFDNHFPVNHDWDDNYDFDDNDDFYYYRKNGTVKKHKKLQKQLRDD
ncbi:hypothetical protein DFQ05_0892 [Winogradskyella wandonensis]|uniref:MORN repeat protein n=1 Tax=Winogradskyella wandonensis TaxID=1442586 RepID=A0A4V2PU72_9FLAO|nr:hypothetical protein [Winogradskyella wandonensis]TCK69371.1 hypothetical protein DFQ05_0892 [Winogradskyella wandonensis]